MSESGHAKAYLAIDLGAESGRVYLGESRRANLSIRELRRFSNHPVTYGKSSHWDVPRLWSEICEAILDPHLPEIASIGVDAWGVDYALIGERGELLQNPYHYRDPRNLSAMDEVLELVPKAEIYSETGVQFMPINTLNQLYAAKRDTPEILAAARTMLMIPDLFHYWLTGTAACEFTAASTTQFASAKERAWVTRLLDRLGLRPDLPAQIVEPGSCLGRLLPELSTSQSRNAQVIAPASHDTASAVAAICATGSTAFLSSGTWSLLGIELDAPIISDQAMRLNFTNEGGIAGTTRLLKNVMGLWMLQGCRKSWNAARKDIDYKELMEAARRERPLRHLVDPDDASFLNPLDMTATIDEFCKKTDQPIPDCPGAYTRAVLESLTLKYRLVIRNLESVIGHPIERIRVIGGGSKNTLLNQFTADATGKQVIAGPSEAAVLGNIGAQMVATGESGSLREVREMIDRSFRSEIFDPKDTDIWSREAERFQHYCEFIYA